MTAEAMITSTRRWIRKYRSPIAYSLGIIGAGYVATQYVLGKISDARGRMSSDRVARENLRRRFEQNQEDCTLTVLALLPTATDNILAEMQTEEISIQLRNYKASNPAKVGEIHSGFDSDPPSVTDDDGRSMASLSESGVHTSQMVIDAAPGDEWQASVQRKQSVKEIKLQLWNDLKISAITRAFTLLYTLALLILLTRLQLNLLGRRSYLSSVVSMATGGNEPSAINLENNDDDDLERSHSNDFDTNRKYLTFSWWLLHRGWKRIMLKVQGAVKEVFDSLSVTSTVGLQKFSGLTLEVRKRIEGTTEEERKKSKWLEYLLPPREEEDHVLKESGIMTELKPGKPSSIQLRRLLDETSDLVESPSFTHVLTLLLDAGFSTLVDTKLAVLAFEHSSAPLMAADGTAPRVTEITDSKAVKLPKVLAPLTRQAHSIGNGIPNEYLEAMEQVRDLEAFAAVVYSSNLETEITLFSHESTSSLVGEAPNVTAKGGDISVQESVVDVGSTRIFESAWSKAGGWVG